MDYTLYQNFVILFLSLKVSELFSVSKNNQSLFLSLSISLTHAHTHSHTHTHLSCYSTLFVVVLVVKSCWTLQPHRLQPARLLCSWDFPGKNTGVVCHFLLQGIFLTQGSNPCLLLCQADSFALSHQGSPVPCLLLIKFRSITKKMWLLGRRHKKRPEADLKRSEDQDFKGCRSCSYGEPYNQSNV